MVDQAFITQLKDNSPSWSRLKTSAVGDRVTAARRIGGSKSVSSEVRLQLHSGEDGLLEWSEADVVIPGLTGKRRGAGGSFADDALMVEFPLLPPSEISGLLLKQDKYFTPNRGLRKLGANMKLDKASLPDSGHVLVIVHGTFSNGDNNIESFLASSDAEEKESQGKGFLVDALKKYSGVYVFDHPTMSVSPILNAIELQRAIGKSKAKIDIISHSRGGLVTRWWCEMFDPNLDRCKNAVLVGSPLAGTGLAAPPNIKKTLTLLTNYGKAFGAVTKVASLVAPIFGIVNILLRVITSMTTLAASTPIADSLMAMVPGLFGQSRVGNNPELLMLHEAANIPDRYAAIISDFQSEKAGWRFWKHFTLSKAVDNATNMLFDGPNDLVVDKASMCYLGDKLEILKKRSFDFGKNNEVHHLSYFSQEKTISFLRQMLQV
jgi:hypothetical protein